MNLQQSIHSKLSANGFGRRRGDRDVAAKFVNKFQPGKSNPSRLTNARALAGSKDESFGSSSGDRLVYLTTCFVGQHVDVQVKNGSMYSGIFHSTNAEKDFGIILKMAHLTKDTSSGGQKPIGDSLIQAPSRTLVIPAKELVQVIAKDVTVTKDGLSNEVHNENQELLIDSFISHSCHVEAERELKPWIPDDDSPQFPELDSIFDCPWNRSWDQFEANEKLFGVKSTFDEELYTTRLERGPQTRELEKEASRIAREIEGEDTEDLHLAEERGIDLHDKFDIDEETRFSSVVRGKVADDSGYDENEEISFNSRNMETFGGSSGSDIMFAGTFSGKCSDVASVSGSSSLNQAQPFQTNIGVDLSRSTPINHARQLASETSCKSWPTLEIESRIQDKHYGENDAEESVEKDRQAANDSQFAKCDDLQSLKKDGPDEGILSDVALRAPSCASSKHNEKLNPPALSDDPESGKSRGEVQVLNPTGRPGSSRSLNSDGAAGTSSGPVLSPSSSIGSLSSEKSTLNPHAKEFKFNPNAKSFTPSQAPVRPPSPAPDGSFYYQSNMPAVPMHGMPYGVGIGPSFAGHQPVVFNPMVAPMQSPHAYVQPNGPQYAQPMLLGHPRPAMYMLGYQPEMPYKGREY
ncbi:polyadenylate-binding protein-interacting protein 3-like isoform X1 [Cucurbita pepo subsp. pepo]|uniref:polyadenylate-binding protein-interacting protein 3-like isoform X1 n=2 Tax=Cucurbita pepo subsp. pepo TaxID=3664 RepID=UPI000C9D9C67|nr:polyadenylate-binding protein-interacting protein 3-like isoform X1 [Cucurbita pepo subsp. pepo]XP_023524689.1 polyadenylate-binding protein-interacting protein 3-like isoform X1 [Cucurbita pepo subsp. pepo]XP_023524690.1 polyadenylate-binding protein-interacting protein 3-like isoform X1 [Cucurbita pepo subsp. pepo]